MTQSITILHMFLCLCLHSLRAQNWRHHIVLDGDDIYHLYWNSPRDEKGDNEITFKVEVKAKGYFGLGFSPNGGMPGSDIVTGWITNGKIYFQDRHAVDFSLPLIDEQQNYELLAAEENDTFTIFEFRRKLDTCDENDMVIDDSTMRVIYAFSNEDPTTADPFYHHENRGVKSIMLLRSKNNEYINLNSTSVLHWDIRSTPVNISSVGTLYWCDFVKTPELSEKHHIIAIKPLIQKGNEEFVHHIMVFDCSGGTPEEMENILNNGGNDCYDTNMPAYPEICSDIITAWAIGGQGVVLPKHVGLPLDAGPGKYFLIQIHYDNHQNNTGITDNSGIRYYYTPQLREFDAGQFTVAASVEPRVFAPPGQKEYIAVGHSSYECLQSAFPDSGVKALGNFLHSHTIVRRMKARHFRGNKEIIPLADDKNYDFRYQDYRYYSEEVDILPNDHISMECTFDSSQRNKVTFSGPSTAEEMCILYILYYPLVNKSFSYSCPTLANINKVLKTNITRDEDLRSALDGYDWQSTDIGEVENALRYSEQVAQCQLLVKPDDSTNYRVSYPRDFIPYEPKSTCNATV